ncbi:MAG TPA: hypothetical protein VER96_28430 [Polyangiaceae bacterium]|nr:hypothetical protein [Polyangiaceae bacterium]
MNSKPILTSLLLTLLFSGTAHAQAVATAAPTAPVWYPQEPPAHVRIEAAASTELEVFFANAPAGSAAVAHCQDHCDFWAWPGKYTLHVREHNTGKPKVLPLRVTRSSRYMYEPGNDGAATAGLVIAGVGGVASITGLVLLWNALASSYCDGDCSNSSNTAAAGGIAMLAGVIAMPAGMIIYANNRTRLAHYNDLAYPASAAQVRIGVVGLGLGGFGLGGTATF